MDFTDNIAITPKQLAELISALDESVITAPTLKKILIRKFDGDEMDPIQIARSNKWIVSNDEQALVSLCESILLQNPKKVQEYRSTINSPKNNTKRILSYFVGLVMKTPSVGASAKPQRVLEILKNLLDH
ncbi:Aspartyl/glutamyl-tRNA(Asn/Gln) amidotransferase subunit B [Smittium mucronatum]|uniref:Aspartyl/glutamyl-tRNA(Asn/Gln) amidotransferase subunit B n=1 Tax=Smittium mucronatum TaxID=133383 RepID=A0A1R0GR32_9FUNG|nr:Aspartyl/glutamyl-tRNA(Asn/Gln) amidotransferase subunit B [Smittium mucronatum]